MNINFSRIKKAIDNLNPFLKEASGGGSNTQITNSNLKNFQIKRVGWSSDSSDYSTSENDLSEVKSAIETDSYVKVALDKMHQLIFKAGYKINSDNEAAVEYLKQRIRIMEFGTGDPFDILLKETGRDLVYYSNAFWVKSRVDKIQGGIQIKPVFGKKPVGGYFRLDPTIVEIKRDNNGLVSKYKVSGDEEIEFNAADVVHFYTDRDPQNNFGTPRIISTLEDVKILRKIEGNSLALIYRFAIPLYQMKIGLPEQNFMATQQEIEEAQDAVNNMPMDGILVTNERTQISAVGADGKAIELPSYLSYFEGRVFSGLNISQAMMGRGGNKQDADSMEGLMHDTVKHYQDAIKIFLEKKVFNELLLEGGYNPIFNEQDLVFFEFNEINLDTKVKVENHVLNKFQSNGITFDEMRHAMGMKAETVDESRLYTNMITTKSAVDVINAKVGAETSTGNGNLKNGKTSSDKPNGAVKSTATPTNQHGTTSAKMKEMADMPIFLREDSNDPEKTKSHVKEFRYKYAKLYKSYTNMRNEISEKGKFNKADRNKYAKLLSGEFERVLFEFAKEGYVTSQLSGNKTDFDSFDNNIKHAARIKQRMLKHVTNLIEDISAQISKREDKNIIDVFNFFAYRLRFAAEYLSGKSYWNAFIYGCKQQGFQELKLNLSDDHSKEHDSVISTDSFNIDNIPPFTPYCSCEVVKPEKEN